MVPGLKFQMNFLANLPIYLFFMDVEFPSMEKPLKANPTAQEKILQAQSVFSYPVCVLLEKTQA